MEGKLLLLLTGGLLLAAAGPCLADDDDNQLNALIDEAIYEATVNLTSKGLDKIALPPVNMSFKVKSLLNMRVEMNLTEAVFWNTTSLARVGDVGEVDSPDGTMTFTLALGLKQAKANFTFAYRLGLLHSSKRVHLECGENSVFLQVASKYDDSGNCEVSLPAAELRTLGKFKLEFYPSDLMDRLEAKILGFAFNRLAGLARKEVNKVLAPEIRQYMDKMDICKLLPF